MNFQASFTRIPVNLSVKTIPYLAVARFSGVDAGAFLQSQLSADVSAASASEVVPACYCTPKGQVLGLLLVGRDGEDFLVAGKRSLLPGILRRLRMYVLRSKVVVSEAPDLAVSGSPGPDYRFVEAADKRSVDETWHADELRAGIAWLDAGSQEKFIPQMLGFDRIGAVSFKKGCYPGQEIVARARYLGKVKRKPLVLEVRGAPAMEPGDRVRLLRGDAWSDAVVVDQAPDGDSRVVFTVTQEGETPVERIAIGDDDYRCATI